MLTLDPRLKQKDIYKIMLWFDSPVGSGHIGVISQLAKDLELYGAEVHIASGSFHSAHNFDFSRIVVERTRPDFPRLLANAHLLISQGGSTLPQAVSYGIPSLIIPSAWSLNHMEQDLRASLFAGEGLTVKRTLTECTDPEVTAKAITEAARLKFEAQGFKGGQRIAHSLEMDLILQECALMKGSLERLATHSRL